MKDERGEEKKRERNGPSLYSSLSSSLLFSLSHTFALTPFHYNTGSSSLYAYALS
jgi:hypothetical protein